MGISIPGRVVVFDYGEVISVAPSETDRAALTELAGSDAEVFWPAYWRHRDALDQGTMSIRQYWRGIERELGESWGDATIHRLWLADFRSWLTIDHETLDVLLELREGGTRMASSPTPAATSARTSGTGPSASSSRRCSSAASWAPSSRARRSSST